MRTWIAIAASIAASWAGASAARAEEAPSVYRVGDVVEDHALEPRAGEKVTLHSFRGKVVLLNFWASW